MSRVGRFGLRVLLWLPPCFAAWYFLSILFVGPIAFAVDQLLSLVLPALATDATQYGNRLEITLHVVGAGYPGASADTRTASFYVHPLDYCYGVALFSALSFAAWGDARQRAIKWTLGVMVLFVFAILGVASNAIKIIVFDALPQIGADVGWTTIQYNLEAFMFKSMYLIVTPVSPIVLWLWQYRDDFVPLGKS